MLASHSIVGHRFHPAQTTKRLSLVRVTGRAAESRIRAAPAGRRWIGAAEHGSSMCLAIRPLVIDAALFGSPGRRSPREGWDLHYSALSGSRPSRRGKLYMYSVGPYVARLSSLR